jgi:hypothetical protein
MTINLPKEVLQKEAFKTFPAKEKEEYVGNLLKTIVELNPEGVTISQIKEATGLTYSTIWHHMEVLSHTAQARKISRGNLDVYYPAGKHTHLNEHTHKKANYSIGVVENNEGRFVCIHERRENRRGSQTVCKGIHIPFELIDDFIKEFTKIKKKSE